MKKRIKKKLSKGEPHNYYFWRCVVSKPDEIREFINRGDKRQKDSIRLTLEYMKIMDVDKFEEIEGSKIIKLLNTKDKSNG